MALDDDAVAAFLIWLAQMQSRFREAHIAAAKAPYFTKVSTDVYPSRLSPFISISLMAELRESLDQNKHAVGIQLTLEKTDDSWTIEVSVGWSGSDIGWDTIEDRVATSPSLESLFEQSTEMVEWLVARFHEQCALLPSLHRARADRQTALAPLAQVLRAGTSRSSAEDRLLNAIENGWVIRCTPPHLNLPASQLASTFAIRRDVERQRRSTNGDPLWWGLDELVVALEAMGEERVHSQSVETDTHDLLVFFSSNRVGVAYRALPRGE